MILRKLLEAAGDSVEHKGVGCEAVDSSEHCWSIALTIRSSLGLLKCRILTSCQTVPSVQCVVRKLELSDIRVPADRCEWVSFISVHIGINRSVNTVDSQYSKMLNL